MPNADKRKKDMNDYEMLKFLVTLKIEKSKINCTSCSTICSHADINRPRCKDCPLSYEKTKLSVCFRPNEKWNDRHEQVLRKLESRIEREFSLNLIRANIHIP